MRGLGDVLEIVVLFAFVIFMGWLSERRDR